MTLKSTKTWLGLAMVQAALFGAIFAPMASAQAQQAVVLRGITPWTADYDLSNAYFKFQELVNARLKGKVTLTYLGGPEVVPPNQQVQALKNGVVDVVLGAAAYYRGEVPMAAAVQFSNKLPSELRKAGYYDIMRKMHLDQGGVIYLANTAGGNRFRMYTAKKIDKPDFSGMKMRVSPVYAPLVRALGGAPVSMAPADVYTAMERGVVDGYGWTYTGIDVFGWNEVTKFVIDHPFYSLDGAILINKAVWDKLPAEVQATLEQIGADLEVEVQKYISDKLAREDQKLRKLGVQPITFSKPDAERYIKVAYEAGWKDFVEKNADAIKANPGLLERLQRLGN
ncbi:MAG: TRAP transporter substrate-binding protein DctP [Betaproteobacteria bacterium]